MYGQDLSDLEYVAAIISDPAPLALGDSGNGHDGEHRPAGTAVADPSRTGGQQ
jgi:hypothetical protein